MRCRTQTFLACGSMVLAVFCISFFRSQSEKRNTKARKVPLRIILFEHRVSSVIESLADNRV
jgi:hypothetical protein